MSRRGGVAWQVKPKSARGASGASLMVVASVWCVACQESAPAPPTEVIHEPLRCVEDRECGAGARCEEDLGICASDSFGFGSVLLEVVPPSTDSGFGGFRLFQRLSQLNASPRSPAVIELLEPPRVGGEVVLASAPGTECDPIPVRVTLTPQEHHLGVGTLRYAAVSERVFPSNAVQSLNRFSFDGVPLGTYDLYWEDSGQVQGIPEGCEVVPQIFRNLQINEAQEFELVQRETRPLRVVVPWQPELEGWLVDVVHGVTGQRMSTARALTESMLEAGEQDGARAIAQLRLSELSGAELVGAGQLLRLRPPRGSERPTMLMDLAVLEVLESGVARVPRVTTFDEQVTFVGWVWEEGSPEVPVHGTVEFIASSLLEVPDGIFVSYSRQAEIGSDGSVAVELPPGNYRARIHPEGTTASVFETGVTVWGPSDDSGEQQAGQVFEVPRGVRVSGVVELSGGLNAEYTMARVVPLRRGGPTNPLGAAAFTPRGANALARANGTFVIDPVDCRNCDGEVGATYALVIAPPAETWLPWVVASPVVVSSARELGAVRVAPPALHFGLLRFRSTSGSVGPFPSALVRAYALLDREHQPVSVGSPLCVETSATEGCIHRALQIGEARTGVDGAFQLLLSSELAELRP